MRKWVPLPDSKRSLVTYLDDDVLTTLSHPVARARTNIADNDAETAPRRTARLAELRCDHDVTELVTSRQTERDTVAGIAGIQVKCAIRQPRAGRGVGRPIQARRGKRLVEHGCEW